MNNGTATAARPLVSVIVEGYNESHDLGTVADTLAALSHQDFPLDRVEVVLVGTFAQVSAWNDLGTRWPSFHGVKTVAADGAHYFQLKNAGAAAADGEILAFTDSDACAQPGWLGAITQGIGRQGADVVVGPSLFRDENGVSDSALMQTAASISWGFTVGKNRNGRPSSPPSFLSHNVAMRAEAFRRFKYRTDLGRTCGAQLLCSALRDAGANFALQPGQKVAHAFTWRWWLANFHFRAGYEVFMFRRLDKNYPNRWIARTKLFEPLVTLVWHVLINVPRWFRYSTFIGISAARRVALLPLLVGMSIAASTSEMLGMYATLIRPQAMKRWAETS